TLRRYSPSLIVVRQGLEDIELNNIQIPKGTNIEIPIPILQQLPDALHFNPKRFEHGVLEPCKFPQAYMPFGVVVSSYFYFYVFQVLDSGVCGRVACFYWTLVPLGMDEVALNGDPL
ncbi:unnamed protein product, partial [Prunus brigantina]